VRNAFATSLLLAACLLAGCGRVTSTGPAMPGTSASSTGTNKMLAPTPMQEPLAVETQPALTTPVQPTTGAVSCLGLNACVDTTPLTLTGIEKEKKGFLWRYLRVNGKVYNQGTQPLSGEVQIRFMKKGEVVQTTTKPMNNVPSGHSVAFDAESPVAADDAMITVSTRGLPETKTVTPTP
jgi:hypothetical protein